MLLPQLHAVAKRARVDAGPGLLVFDVYQQARQVAQTIASIASHVAIREVTAGADGAAVAGEGWTAASGKRYRAVPGGVTIEVKAQVLVVARATAAAHRGARYIAGWPARC